MRRKAVVVAALFVLGACGEKPTQNAAGVSVDARVCNQSTTVINEAFRPVRYVLLLNSPEEGAEKVLNKKATQVMGENHYHGVSGSEQVLEQCQKDGYSYVTMLEPEWLKGVSGWALTKDLKDKANPDDPYEGRISEWILDGAAYREPITDSNGRVSPTFQGKLPEIKEQSIAAAKKALGSASCLYVESVIFDRLSSSHNSFSFIVDCSEGKRFTFNSQDILSSTQALPDSERAITEQAAQEECKSMIRSRVTRPETVKFNDLIGASYYKNETNGNVRYVLDFESKNQLDSYLKYKAICIFEPSGGSKEITITDR